MANPSGFGADAAYDRAVAAFSQQSYDVARRWVLEALAQNPEHPGARALLARLDSVRRPPSPATRPAASRPSPYGSPAHAAGSETVSTDPTVLINHASRTPAPDGIEPTVLVQRDHPRRPAAPDPFAPVRSPMHDTAPTSEPTVIRRPSEPPPSPRPRTAPAGGGVLQKWRDLFGGPRAAAPRPAPKTPRAGGLSPQMRGAALVLGAVVAAALLLALGIAAVRWMWPAGQKLTLTRPTGGTIVGPGIKCGSNGDDCSTERPTGDVVELEATADAGFLFTGFTGDCAPAGRIAMSAPRKCGATFDAVAAVPKPVTFPLTIDKPVGGTIATDVGNPNILCGKLGDVCATEIPSGSPVVMHREPADGFAFQAFTKDCANGEIVMNSAKTCGAMFMKTETAVITVPDSPGPRNNPGRDRGKARPDEGAASRTGASADAGPKGTVPPPPPPPPGPQPGQPQQPQVTTTSIPAEPAKAPISAEQHAKEEIETLVKSYCSANETLKPEAVQKLFPLAPMATYRGQFKEYKTLKCTITSKPEFQRLDPSATGGAQVLFGMKQVIQMKSGGAPTVYETNVTMVVSRTSFQAPWLIDRLVAEEKPK